MMTAEMVTPSKALGLLSSMYLCKPSPTAIENWKMALSGDSPVFIRDLEAAILVINTTSQDEMEELLWEYTRLFIGPYKLPCPPWESVYTSPKRLMLQDAADQVQQLYREAGLSLETHDIMPDHIGAELNFLALLLEKSHSEADNKEQFMRITDVFLNDHLLKWIPDFARDMEHAAETSFYKALARVTSNVIELIGK